MFSYGNIVTIPTTHPTTISTKKASESAGGPCCAVSPRKSKNRRSCAGGVFQPYQKNGPAVRILGCLDMSILRSNVCTILGQQLGIWNEVQLAYVITDPYILNAFEYMKDSNSDSSCWSLIPIRRWQSVSILGDIRIH